MRTSGLAMRAGPREVSLFRYALVGVHVLQMRGKNERVKRW
jgi:hypothetical protein